MAPRLIFCYGGNRRFVDIAIAAGFEYGARLPSSLQPYPLAFADQDWRKPDLGRYLAAVQNARPEIASVLDWEHDEQLPEVLQWAEAVAPWVDRIMVIPKVVGGIERLPRKVGGKALLLGYSVPTKHGATPVPFWEFGGWDVHLLGGSPHRQIREWHYLAAVARVVSADGNMSCKMASRGRWWNARSVGRDGFWHRLADDLHDAPYRCFERSCANIAAAWALLTDTTGEGRVGGQP